MIRPIVPFRDTRRHRAAQGRAPQPNYRGVKKYRHLALRVGIADRSRNAVPRVHGPLCNRCRTKDDKNITLSLFERVSQGGDTLGQSPCMWIAAVLLDAR